MIASTETPAAPPTDRRRFGLGHLVVVALAAAFLAAAVTYAVQARLDSPSGAEVAFLQDMIVHHENAVESSLLVADADMPPGIEHFAQEVVIFQQYEIGLMEATLRQWGEPRTTGDESMEWMGEGHPPQEMPGMASDETLAELGDAEGEEAAALWLAVMSRHHLAGAEMADAGGEVATDAYVADLAERFSRYQRQEISEYSTVRESLGLPVPDGYTDPPTLDDDHGVRG